MAEIYDIGDWVSQWDERLNKSVRTPWCKFMDSIFGGRLCQVKVTDPKSRNKLNKILREEFDAKYILPKVKDPYLRFDLPEGKTLFLLKWA